MEKVYDFVSLSKPKRSKYPAFSIFILESIELENHA